MRRFVPDWSWLLVALLAAPAAAEESAPDTNAGTLLRQSCGDCHFDGAEEGGIAIDSLLGRLAADPGSTTPADHAGLAPADDITAWVSVWKNLRGGIMPPADATQPSADDRQAMERYLETTVLGVDSEQPDPGEIVLRRLNRVEYANTVRDLTGVDIDVTFELPPDDTGYGFDTIGAVLSISPLLLEKYVAVAGRVAETIAAEARPNDAGEYPEAYRRLFPAGPLPAEASQRDAHLRSTLRRLADRGYRRPVDDETLDRLMAVAAGAGDETTPFEHRIAAAAAAVIASPRFLFRIEDVSEPAAEQAFGSRAVPVDEFSLASRLSYFLWSTMPDDELFTLAAEGRLRQELEAQVARLIADPRSDAFVENFVGQWLQTRDVETLPFDLETVFIVNEEGGEEQRRRGGGRRFSYHLRQAIKRETEMLFAHLLREGLPATDLITGRSTFVNEDLARFYGIPGIEGRSMQLVELPEDSHRRGLLTQASFLMVTSNPSRTSPVKRGLFILTNLLGTPPPPAPPDVPALEEAVADVGEQATMRELMVRHRQDPLCASCHARMDPLGLALEQYNAIGQWRGEQAAAIDTAGRLITGESFGSVQELADTIAGARKRDYLRCLTEKLLTYALGRGVEYFDAPAVDTIVEAAEAGGSLAGIVTGVVSSVPFQCRRR